MRRPLFALVLLAVATTLLNGSAPLRAEGAAARQTRPVRPGRPAGGVAPAPAPPSAPLPPSFAPTLDRDAARWVDATLKSLSDDQLVGQLLMGRLDSTYLSADSAAFEALAALVREVHIGGFCAFGGVEQVPAVMLNGTYGSTILGQPLELAALLNRLQTISTVPLIVAGDFEHGVGMRISGATRFPRAMAFGAAADPDLVRAAARITAVESRALGVHVNFAPVADVNNNPRNPVINIRSFGEDPTQVGAMVRAAVEGLQSGGVVATLKHFPGHGDTAVDTHLGLATVPHDRERLDRVELAPFQAGIAAGAGAAMVAHVEMPALDPLPGPATFSRPVVRGLLRHELQFNGVVYSDSMLMEAVNAMAEPGEAAVRAIEAGIDVVLDSPDPRAAAAAIKAAMATGRLTRAQLEGSVGRVLAHKARLGLHRSRTVDLNAVMSLVGTRAGAEAAQVTAERAITLLRDERQSVPLSTPRSGRVLYLSVLDYPSNWRIAAPSRTLLPELRKRWSNVTAVELSDRSTADELDLVRAMAASHDAVVAGVFVRASSGSGRLDLAPSVVRLLQDLSTATARRKQPLVAAFFGSPYAAEAAASLPAVLVTYDFGDYAETAAVRAIAGEVSIQGKLPVALGAGAGVGAGLTRPVATTPKP